MLKLFNKRRFFLYAGIVLLVFTLSCFHNEDSSSPTGSSTDTTGTGDSDGSDSGGSTELTFFEEELVGLWYRYHAYRESDRYIRINADRTACKWSEDSGSNRREDKSSYSYWEITEELSNNKFKVSLQGSWYTFDYPNNTFYPSGYSDTLKHRPSTSSGKLCE